MPPEGGLIPPNEAAAKNVRFEPCSSWEGSDLATLGEIVMIHDLQRQGLSISAIARSTGHDRKTIRNYLDLSLEAPVYGPREQRLRFL